MATSALVIVEPYASLIVSGAKTLELRSTTSHKVGQVIGIIAKGTGTVIGVVRIDDVIGPVTRDELDELRHQHLASAEDLAAHPTWRFGWRLAGAIRFQHPVPYQHPMGAQTYVTLSTTEALAVHLAMAPADVRGLLRRSQAARDVADRR
ncbi:MULTISPECIES: ASCH domain-containing protein [Roseomonadaceae]|uniref:ASCH domain-containing protein n=1 Tax=Falsiroseomonas oleicola TaxID=2801474 RepID=A0ABS6H406_9PROT|nr:ASCH domain-containing protein [Roseomonas oleicola]MBU8543410.1 ASCH domain-containing protein [Roseomonas oleicola]